MGLKPVICAGFVVLAFSIAVPVSSAYAQEKQGFFDKIFNRSDSRSTDAKPLFLNQEGATQSRSSAPYDYNQSRRSIGQSQKDREKAARAAEKQKRRDLHNQQVAAMTEQSMAEVRQNAHAFYAAYEEEFVRTDGAIARSGSGSRSSTGTNKKMVYDPGKAWSIYSIIPQRNNDGEEDTGSRIYNRR